MEQLDTKPKLLVVLGMQCSGTSAITRGLRVLGATLDGKMMPGGKGNNDRRFWEDIDLNALSIEVMEAAGRARSDLSAITQDDVRMLRAAGYVDRAVALMHEKTRGVEIFGFKDPRVGKLLPFWQEVFAVCGYDVRYVLMVRHPMSVAQSLAKRDGFSLRRGYLLWLGHVIPGVASTEGQRRVVVDYDRLMARPAAELERLAERLDLRADQNELALYQSELMDEAQRHTIFTMDDLRQAEDCPPLVAAIYPVMLDIAADRRDINATSITKAVHDWENALARLRTPFEKIDTFVHDGQNQQTFVESQLPQAMSDTMTLQEENSVLQSNLAQTISHTNMLQKQLENEFDRCAQLQNQNAFLNLRVTDLETAIHNIRKSTSWKITGPLRVFMRLVRNERPYIAGGVRNRIRNQIKPLYWCLPARYRHRALEFGFRHFGYLFRDLTSYELWQAQRSQKHVQPIEGQQLLPIEGVAPCSTVSGRIAIHLHIYYTDLAEEFAAYLRNMPFDYDLFVSTPHTEGSHVCRTIFTGLPRQKKLVVEQAPNRGRDIAPMFCTFGSHLKHYDYVAHLHSKKSLYNNGATKGWREYLCDTLLGSETQIRRIFTLLQDRGLVYPQNYNVLPYQANTWLANMQQGAAWCRRLGINNVPRGYFNFPAGSMFWAKGQAIAPLFSANISLEDFPEESGQTDGTFAHCLERLFVLVSNKQGFQAAILKDQHLPRWSAWGFEQYAQRSLEAMYDQFGQSRIKVIAFDIFDTLLVRPLLDAEQVKDIVARRVNDHTAALYLEYRSKAEGAARDEAGRDVSLEQIYTKFASMTSLPAEQVETLKHMEIEVEQASVSPRSGGMCLLSKALESGKKVILVSDMFLPMKDLKNILKDNGITEYDNIFLSNDIGYRKDDGRLYKEILLYYNIEPKEMLMIGDNERSDFQIPCDMGIHGMHLLKPVEFARGLPRLNSIVTRTEAKKDLNQSLTLGLILKKNFSDVSYPDLDPYSLVSPCAYHLGYSLIGPLLTAMVQWLIESAHRDKVKTLYFLAREGKVMRKVYDLWCEGLTNAPTSHYLVVSRRAVSVPTIHDLQDIFEIARATYSLNTFENFLHERFGVRLSASRWAEVKKATGLTTKSNVRVRGKAIDALKPALTFLAQDIMQHATKELHAMERYLDQSGLTKELNAAVVDVGYAGTIQSYLTRLLNRPVHGYYMMTVSFSPLFENQDNLIFNGCYLDGVDINAALPQMFASSFELEKMLSADDAQVIRYELDAAGNAHAQYRDLSSLERQSAAFREDLQTGACDFVKDARQIRASLFPDFKPSTQVARELYEEFIVHTSDTENACLKNVFLDDYYCGRGVVN